MITNQTSVWSTEINAPDTTKDSREALHDTSNATDSVKDWRTYWKDVLNEPNTWVGLNAKQKIVNDFLDTICCALEEMNGEEVFNCFFEAVQSQHEYTKKEHDKISELMYLLIKLK
jgi:hypothetical protein